MDRYDTYITPYGEYRVPPQIRSACFVRAIRRNGREDVVAIQAYALRLLGRYMHALGYMFWRG